MTGIQILLSAVVASTGVVGNANNSPLRWHDHYGTAKSVAQQTRRPMVVVIENPRVETEKLDVQGIAAQDRRKMQTEKFELCRVNVNTVYGKKVAEAFGVSTFPHTVVTDELSKKIVFRKSGQMDPGDWTLALAKSEQAPVEHLVQKPVIEDANRQVIHQPAQQVVQQPQQYLQQPAQHIISSPTIITDYGTPVFGGSSFPQQIQYMPASGTCFT